MPADPHTHGRIGILLVNLGSPDAPTPEAVRRYLNEFLSDRRVVEIPPLVWQPILKGAVLTTRPKQSAANYAHVWDKEANDSPLRVHTKALADALAAQFGPQYRVDFAMRYGNPSIDSRVEAMLAAGCDRLLFAPLYPQYCAATTGSALDALFRSLSARRALPAIRTLPPYFAHPAHIAALATSTREALDRLPFRPQTIVLSFHGMPARTRDLGDPYHDQCQQTGQLLREALGYTAENMPVTFQSRFGRAKWLEPYTEPTLIELARRGVRRVAVAMPGFSADCLETLEEIDMRARDAFLAAGGEAFAALPCLNASATAVDMMQNLVSEQLAGWEVSG